MKPSAVVKRPRKSWLPKTLLEWVLLFVMLFIVCAVFYPVSSGPRRASGTMCLSNLKQLALGVKMYQGDNDGLLPLRDSWMDASTPYVKSEGSFHCEKLQEHSKDKDIYGYSFNAKLSSAKEPPNPYTVELIFDSTNLGRNASGSLESLPVPGRHGSGNNVVFVDGHAKRKAR